VVGEGAARMAAAAVGPEEVSARVALGGFLKVGVEGSVRSLFRTSALAAGNDRGRPLGQAFGEVFRRPSRHVFRGPFMSKTGGDV